jgi:hypothetical protein
MIDDDDDNNDDDDDDDDDDEDDDADDSQLDSCSLSLSSARRFFSRALSRACSRR